MLIFGERFNSSRKPVLEAFRNRDEKYLVSEAQKQEKAGAHYIDINTAALLDKEIETLEWAIPLLQKEISIPLSIDTPNTVAIEKGLTIHKGKAVLNSLNWNQQKINRLLPLIKEYEPYIIVLCMEEKSLPRSSEEELAIAVKMVSFFEKEGIDPNRLFIDPLVHPIGVNQQSVILFLESLNKIKQKISTARTIAGLSNVSFGLPKRRLLNRTFLVLSLSCGLDAAILDPLDKDLVASISAANALLGKDPGLKDYLKFIRGEKKRVSPILPLD